MSNEVLFLIGNGTSIASADEDLREILGALTMKDFVKVFRASKNNIKRREAKDKFGSRYKKCGDIFNQEHGTGKIDKLVHQYNTDNVITLLEKLYAKVKRIQNQAQREFDKANLHEGIDQIFDANTIQDDFETVLSMIYSTILNYYKCFEEKYYSKLFSIVKNKSFVISLNWDINFERVIYEETNVPMENYYGDLLFHELNQNQQRKPLDPVVKILKPHGSLNQYFIGGSEGGFGGQMSENEYHLVICDELYRYDELYDRYLLLPPLQEKMIPELNKADERNLFDRFNIRRVRILKRIRQLIRDVIKETKELIIIGYSFPKEDRHILELFKDNKIEKIWVFDTDLKVFKRIDSYFPGKKLVFMKKGFQDIVNFNISQEVYTDYLTLPTNNHND